MRRHATDMVSLIFGIVFVGIAGWWLITRYVHIQIPHLGWVAAAALIAIGALGIFGSLRGDRPATPVQPAPEPAAAEPTTSEPTTSEPATLKATALKDDDTEESDTVTS